MSDVNSVTHNKRWMTQLAISLLLSSILTGCFDDRSDLLAFQEKVAQQIKPGIPPIKQLPSFTHVPYQAPTGKETPFTFTNQAQQAEDNLKSNNAQQESAISCSNPALQKTSHPLEAYALETLVMRGVLYSDNAKKAIVEASDKQLHIVKTGDVIGTFHGNITAINENAIAVTEWIPDGLGCYKPRQNQIQLTQSMLNE